LSTLVSFLHYGMRLWLLFPSKDDGRRVEEHAGLALLCTRVVDRNTLLYIEFSIVFYVFLYTFWVPCNAI